MFAIELGLVSHRFGRRGSVKRLLEYAQYLFRFRWLHQYLRDAAGCRQVAGLPLQESGGVEDHVGIRDLGVGAQLPNELVAVHRRHQDVANHEVRPYRAHLGKGQVTVRGFQRLVTGVLQQRDEQVAIWRMVVDDKHFGHGLRLSFNGSPREAAHATRQAGRSRSGSRSSPARSASTGSHRSLPS